MAISFKTDIVPLFTSVDIEHMSRLDDWPMAAAGLWQVPP